MLQHLLFLELKPPLSLSAWWAIPHHWIPYRCTFSRSKVKGDFLPHSPASSRSLKATLSFSPALAPFLLSSPSVKGEYDTRMSVLGKGSLFQASLILPPTLRWAHPGQGPGPPFWRSVLRLDSMRQPLPPTETVGGKAEQLTPATGPNRSLIPCHQLIDLMCWSSDEAPIYLVPQLPHKLNKRRNFYFVHWCIPSAWIRAWHIGRAPYLFV